MHQNTTYIIHERPHIEKKKFVVLFTYEYGICSVPIRNKQQVAYFILYQIYCKHHNRITLQSPLESKPILTGKALYCGLYLNELIYQFCKPNDAHPALFNAYRQTLIECSTATHLDPILRRFELTLLKEAGYELNLSDISSEFVYFCSTNGIVPCNKEQLNSIKLLHLQEAIFQPYSLPTVKNFMRTTLNHLLTRNIQSRFFYDKVIETTR